MNENFSPRFYPTGTKVIFTDKTNTILPGTIYLSPGNYYLGKKILAIDTSDAEAEQQRLVKVPEERERQGRERMERVYMEIEERQREEEAARQGIREAGAEARAIAPNKIESAPPNNEGQPWWYNTGNQGHWGGRKSRRGRKSKKSRKRRSMKRRSNRRRGRH